MAKKKSGSLKPAAPQDWAGEYVAMAVIQKPGTNGLWVLRKIRVKGDEVLDIEDNPEDLKDIQLAKMDREYTS